MNNDEIIKKVLKTVEVFLEKANVDKGHGIDHIYAVLNHVEKALQCYQDLSKLDSTQILAIKVAAVLHDVDDHKFFTTSNECTNAKMLLESVRSDISDAISASAKSNSNSNSNSSASSNLSYNTNVNAANDDATANVFDHFVQLVKTMIDAVTCSKNGNSNDDGLPDWMLYPRIADRLEAIGVIGIVRALQYGEYKNRLLYDELTERVYTKEELHKVASPERFIRYMTGDRSRTTMGHVYDKIIHIGRYDFFNVKNTYFKSVASTRMAEVEEWVLNFWHSLPENYPKAARYQMTDVSNIKFEISKQ